MSLLILWLFPLSISSKIALIYSNNEIYISIKYFYFISSLIISVCCYILLSYQTVILILHLRIKISFKKSVISQVIFFYIKWIRWAEHHITRCSLHFGQLWYSVTVPNPIYCIHNTTPAPKAQELSRED